RILANFAYLFRKQHTQMSSEPPKPEFSLADWHIPGLLASYERFGGINEHSSHNLPSKGAISQICHDLLQLLFPGFHDDDAITEGTLAQVTAERLHSVIERLQVQVRKSVRVGEPQTPTGKTAPIMKKFARTIPVVRELLKHDVEAALDGDPSVHCHEEIILSFPFIEAIAIQRLAHRLYKEGVPIIPRMMTEWAHSRTGIDIHPGASIGTHFFIDHGTGVVIGETCKIGNNVKLYHGVTLGARSFAKDESGKLIKGTKRHPNVEDHVTIYPNSTILGGETTIGEGSTIGANVFLMHSVPPNSLVLYEPKGLQILDKKNQDRKNHEPPEFSI
ncbi:MAG: serine O-acetyltransferase EpsC, partial [Verrucomicrobiales bacterium]